MSWVGVVLEEARVAWVVQYLLEDQELQDKDFRGEIVDQLLQENKVAEAAVRPKQVLDVIKLHHLTQLGQMRVPAFTLQYLGQM